VTLKPYVYGFIVKPYSYIGIPRGAVQKMRSIGDDRGEATFSFSAHALSCVNICIV